MKPSETRPNVIRLLLTIPLLASVGCSHLAAKRTSARLELDEHSRVFTTAVVDSLQLQPEAHRDEFTDFALSIAREDQRIEGLPARPLPVAQLIPGGETNSPAALERVTEASQQLESRFRRVQTLLERERTVQTRLQELGQRYEAESNRTNTAWWKWGGATGLGLGGLVAASLFFPAAAPIAGRILALLVDRLPGAAGATGVVSVRAFDALVKAIERSKTGVRLGNDATTTPSWLDELHASLSRELDASHKRLVSARKRATRNE